MAADRSDLESAVLGIARRTGVEPGDLSDEHVRWEVGLRAMESPAEWGPLREMVGLEPEPSVAVSVVLRMVERVPAAERLGWAERIAKPAQKRAFAVQRVRDLRVLEHVSGEAGAAYALADDEIRHWSDWLQRRAAEQSTSTRVPEQLSRDGRTKRVRHQAAERSRALRRHGRRGDGLTAVGGRAFTCRPQGRRRRRICR